MCEMVSSQSYTGELSGWKGASPGALYYKAAEGNTATLKEHVNTDHIFQKQLAL